MTYPSPAFDNAEIERQPGCAIWTDSTGTIILGFTKEGASMPFTPGADMEKADEAGATPLHMVSMGETARIELIMLQTDLARWARVYPFATYTGGNLRFGMIPGQRLPTGKIAHRPFGYPDGSRDLVLEAAVNIADQNFVHNHTEPLVLSCAFEGTLVETNPDGQLLGGGIGQ
jgi:hypothetical protein